MAEDTAWLDEIITLNSNKEWMEMDGNRHPNGWKKVVWEHLIYSPWIIIEKYLSYIFFYFPPVDSFGVFCFEMIEDAVVRLTSFA